MPQPPVKILATIMCQNLIKLFGKKNKKSKFCEILNSIDTKTKIDNFVNQDISTNQNSVDNAIEFVTEVLKNTSTLAGMLLKKGISPRKSSAKSRFLKVKPPKWHDKSCHDMFSSLKQTSALLSKNPKNPWLRGKLATESKQYNKLIKIKQPNSIITRNGFDIIVN